MIFDYLRKFYETSARLVQGSDETFTIRWVQAQPGAKVFPRDSAFSSFVWEGDHVNAWQGIGEVARQRKPIPKRLAMSPGTCTPANLDWFRTGIPAAELLNPLPDQWCCNDARWAVCELAIDVTTPPNPAIRFANCDLSIDATQYTIPGLYASAAELAIDCTDLGPVARFTAAELAIAEENQAMSIWSGARASGTTSVPAVTPTSLDLSAVAYDSNSYVVTGTPGALVVPYAGLYAFDAWLEWATSTVNGTQEFTPVVNGGQQAPTSTLLSTAGDATFQPLSFQLHLAASDTVTFRAVQLGEIAGINATLIVEVFLVGVD